MRITVGRDDSVSAVLAAATDALEGVPPEVTHECEIIVDEFMANMKYHVFPVDSAARWTLELAATDSDVTIIFCYAGEKFDPTPTSTYIEERPIEQRDIGGLGLVLISSLSDEQIYNYHDGMNEWTIRKNY